MLKVIQAGSTQRAPHESQIPRPATASERGSASRSATERATGNMNPGAPRPLRVTDPRSATPQFASPAPASQSQISNLQSQIPPQAAAGLGDHIERLVKPFALALQKLGATNCLDENRELRPESPCARRRAKLNKLGKKVGM